MSVKAVEGWSYSEAWCENCGWRIQENGEAAAMSAAEDHAEQCAVERPSVLGEHKTLWKVET